MRWRSTGSNTVEILVQAHKARRVQAYNQAPEGYKDKSPRFPEGMIKAREACSLA
jgi:hypothetical protein